MKALVPRKELAKRLPREASRHGHSVGEVFRDWVEAMAIAVSNGVDFAQRSAREERYLQLVGRYDATTAQAFAELLGLLVMALEEEPGDVLGELFMQLGCGNDHLGQFFTPYGVSSAIAGLLLEDVGAVIEEKGHITVSEPACGSGGMVVAVAQRVRELGFDPARALHVTAQDVSPSAAHMTYVQLSLLGIPGVVILGDTLRMECRSVWFTPAHVLGAWSVRLGRDLTPSPPPAPSPPTPTITRDAGQLDLFGRCA